MKALTDAQIDSIQEHLTSNGLTYQPLQEELLDHICCMIEEIMWDSSTTFEAAFEAALEGFEALNFEQIQEETLIISISKSMSMKKIAVMTFMLLVAVVFGANAVNELSKLEPSSIMPIASGQATIASGFGYRLHPITKAQKLHKGIDFKIEMGTEILATGGGTVEKVLTHKSGYGKHIVIKHDENYQTMYAHLSDFKVKKGDKVEKGQVVGYSGNTGKSITPHLHYEVLKDGKAVDPATFF
jgi:murein DD-endopeptidase MepM/ murein hydrolase activator NlpD